VVNTSHHVSQQLLFGIEAGALGPELDPVETELAQFRGLFRGDLAFHPEEAALVVDGTGETAQQRFPVEIEDAREEIRGDSRFR
jgi:hypothetical protein